MVPSLVVRAFEPGSLPTKVSPSLSSIMVFSDKSSAETSWESFGEELSSPSSEAGRLPVKAEKSISRLIYTL